MNPDVVALNFGRTRASPVRYTAPPLLKGRNFVRETYEGVGVRSGRLWRWIGLAAALWLAPLPAAAQSFTPPTAISALGATTSQATGINDYGMVTGTYEQAGSTRGFVWTTGAPGFTDIGTLGGTSIFPYAVNNQWPGRWL